MSRKKPVSEHIQNGSYRPSVHGPRPENVPTLPPIAPKRPKSLDKPALVAWKELSGLLALRLRPEDGPQLEQLAVWLSKMRIIVAALDKETPGTTTFSRLVSAASVASQNFDRLAKRFGMAPLDREALKLPSEGTNKPKRW